MIIKKVCKGVNTVYFKKVKTKPHTSCPWRQHYIKDKPLCKEQGSYNGRNLKGILHLSYKFEGIIADQVKPSHFCIQYIINFATLVKRVTTEKPLSFFK